MVVVLRQTLLHMLGEVAAALGVWEIQQVHMPVELVLFLAYLVLLPIMQAAEAVEATVVLVQADPAEAAPDQQQPEFQELLTQGVEVAGAVLLPPVQVDLVVPAS
jgi:hypothetical protein